VRNNAPPLRAGGTVPPARFVKLSTTVDSTILVATAGSGAHGDQAIGISQVGMKRAPGLPGSDTTIAAESGDPLQIFSVGDVCLLTAGSGGWAAGDNLKSDGSGRGITASATGDLVGAIALQAASGTGVQALVQMVIFAHA
jgi:hypothetical protein